jgi:hypothetical protein
MQYQTHLSNWGQFASGPTHLSQAMQSPGKASSPTEASPLSVSSCVWHQICHPLIFAAGAVGADPTMLLTLRTCGIVSLAFIVGDIRCGYRNGSHHIMTSARNTVCFFSDGACRTNGFLFARFWHVGNCNSIAVTSGCVYWAWFVVSVTARLPCSGYGYRGRLIGLKASLNRMSRLCIPSSFLGRLHVVCS